MSIFKDWREDNEGYRFIYKVKSLFNVREWFYLHKWRKQRADRGWSYRDTWGAGEHIAQMTAEMLQCLNDKSHVDWPQWFELNVKEEGKGAYKSMQEVIDDITAYLEYEKTSWADGLDTKRDSLKEIFEKREDGNYDYKSPDWIDKKGKKLSDTALKNRINKWQKEQLRLYKNAIKAMSFFSRHFASFWD